MTASKKRPCRICGTPLTHTFVDLGMSPLCQTHIDPDQLDQSEPFYPLHARVCEMCFLVQLDEFVKPDDIFSDYAYFSSYADSWVAHSKRYADEMAIRLNLTADSHVVEIASNDGYLLQHFVELGIPVLGIEPAENVARVAIERGVRSEVVFFGEAEARVLASKYPRPDLLLGNNVLAHVPDVHDFVAGMKVLLKPEGVITMEFPHLLRLIEDTQFDTIYHEHFSYLSSATVSHLFSSHGLDIFDVQELPTHGGSLRIFAKHRENDAIPIDESVGRLISREHQKGLREIRTYLEFGHQVRSIKREILQMLIDIKRHGRSIAGYGAPGKGNTLLNYCGIRTDFLDYTVDRSPHKQGRFTPGTRIPILAPEALRETRPDFVFILPWNLTDEIVTQTSFIRDWGGKWIVPIPTPRILD